VKHLATAGQLPVAGGTFTAAQIVAELQQLSLSSALLSREGGGGLATIFEKSFRG
jgi:hypothetical protein